MRHIKFSHVRKSKFLSDSDSEPVFFPMIPSKKCSQERGSTWTCGKDELRVQHPVERISFGGKECRAVTSLRLHTTKQLQEASESEFIVYF